MDARSTDNLNPPRHVPMIARRLLPDRHGDVFNKEIRRSDCPRTEEARIGVFLNQKKSDPPDLLISL